MATAAPTLSQDALVDLLSSVKGADSVELKLTIPESTQRATIEALGMDPLDAQIRQVFFFDTPDLTLDARGVVVRARRSLGKGDDSVVKLRPIVPPSCRARCAIAGLQGRDRRDARRFVCSASLKGQPRRHACRTSPGAPLHQLFSKEQRAFYTPHAPDGIGFKDLSVLGRSSCSSSSGTPQGSGARWSWSCGCTPTARGSSSSPPSARPSEAFQVAAEGRAFLTERGIGGRQQDTKTRKALGFYSKQLRPT